MPASSSQHAPLVRMDEFIGGYVHSQLLFVAAKLGLADLIEEVPRTKAELASLLHVHPFALAKLLNALIARGIFLTGEDGKLSLAPGSECLLSKHPSSLCSYILLCGELFYPAFGALLPCIDSGKTAFSLAFEKDFFSYLEEHPHIFAHFHIYMSRRMSRDAQAVLSVYDFSAFHTIVDIGGGVGMFLATIIKAYPHLQGILFDLPATISQARPFLEQAEVVEQCQLVPGNFFVDALPSNGDLYVLALVIHDWDDEQAIQILQKCRQVMSSQSKLIIIDFLVMEKQPPSLRVADEDLFMLTITGGHERTETGFRSLLTKAGLTVHRIIPLQGRRSVIEAIC